MLTKEQQETRALIDQATRPLNGRIDRLEKEVRRLKSDLQQTKTKLNGMKKK